MWSLSSGVISLLLVSFYDGRVIAFTTSPSVNHAVVHPSLSIVGTRRVLFPQVQDRTRNMASDDEDDGNKNNNIDNPTKIESIVANAKSLQPIQSVDNVVKKSSKDEDQKNNKLLTASAAGLAVSLAMIPEAVAFSFVAGVNPLVGLWTTVTLGFVAAGMICPAFAHFSLAVWFLGGNGAMYFFGVPGTFFVFVCSVIFQILTKDVILITFYIISIALGGRAGICSSASGACSVVVASLCASNGPSYLSACAILAGLLQIFGGLVGLGRLIRLVPHPVMLGFVNGLALVMTKAQLVQFRDASTGAFLSLFSANGASMYGVTALTMILVKLLPKITKVVPPTLGAVALSSFIAKLLRLPVKTLSDVAGAATFAGGWSVLPTFGLPNVPFSLQTLRVVFPYAATMAAVGCIESLLTMQLLDGMVDDGKRGSTRKECIGQGCGNLFSGLFGGIGGCALLGQSIINVQSGGGISKISGMSMALFLAAGIIAAAPLLGTVPVAALVGVMLLVCQSTFSWSSLRILRKIPKLDAIVIALVSIITVKADLAQAVVAGTIASALGFAWKQSTTLNASTSTEGNKRLYNLNGPLFFGSTGQFSSLFQPKSDPDEVVLDFTNSRVMDHSALEAIHGLAEQYGSQNKTIYLRHLSKDCTQLLQRLYKGGNLPPYEIIESDPASDPVYGIAEDPSLYADVSA